MGRGQSGGRGRSDCIGRGQPSPDGVPAHCVHVLASAVQMVVIRQGAHKASGSGERGSLLRIEDFAEKLVVPARYDLSQRPSRERGTVLAVCVLARPDGPPIGIVVPPVSGIRARRRFVRGRSRWAPSRRACYFALQLDAFECRIDHRPDVVNEHAVCEIRADRVQADG